MKGSNTSLQQRMIAGIIICFLGASLAFLTSLIFFNSANSPQQQHVDWNILLSNMADVEFCAPDSSSTPPSSQAPTTTGHDDSGNHNLKNYSVAMLVTVSPTKELVDIPHNITLVHGRLFGYQLGLEDDLELEEVNVTLDIPTNLNRCSAGHCTMSKVLTCIHLQAAPHVFPTTRQPEECQKLNESGIEYHTEMRARPRNLLSTRNVCVGTKIKLQPASQPSVSLLLSMPDRSVSSLHLLHTSFFVFIMALMVIASSLFCGKRHTPYNTTNDSESSQVLLRDC